MLPIPKSTTVIDIQRFTKKQLKANVIYMDRMKIEPIWMNLNCSPYASLRQIQFYTFSFAVPVRTLHACLFSLRQVKTYTVSAAPVLSKHAWSKPGAEERFTRAFASHQQIIPKSCEIPVRGIAPSFHRIYWSNLVEGECVQSVATHLWPLAEKECDTAGHQRGTGKYWMLILALQRGGGKKRASRGREETLKEELRNEVGGNAISSLSGCKRENVFHICYRCTTEVCNWIHCLFSHFHFPSSILA